MGSLLQVSWMFFWSLPRLIQVLTGPTSFEEELPKCPDAMDVEMVSRKGIENQAMICEVVHYLTPW